MKHPKEKRGKTPAEQSHSQLPAAMPSPPQQSGIKEGSNLAGGGIPIPSSEAFARRYLRVWTRRLMIVCLLLIVLCVAAVPLLSRLQVKHVVVEGCVHYDAPYLTEQSGVKIGDELLLCSPGDVQARLLAHCPYLLSAQVERKLSGEVYIRVTERRARFALILSETEIALLDETLRVLELCSSADGDAALCTVRMDLSSQADGWAIAPGMTFEATPAAQSKLTTLLDALAGEPQLSVYMLDMTDLYAVTITMEDGTVFALHDCAAPERQLRTAMAALEAYRQKTGDTAPVLVDVDSIGGVFVGVLPQNGK